MLDSTINDRTALVKHGRKLEYFTVWWAILEGVIGIATGRSANSVALFAFGISSLIESLSAGAMLWGLHEGEKGKQRERLTLQLVGSSLLVLAAYIAFDAGKALLNHEPPEASRAGIALSVVALTVMFLLGRAKREVASALDNRALQTDAWHTDACAFQSAFLLVGLGLNALFGWWWADPVAALVMVPIIAKEGFDALRGEACGCSSCD